MDIRAIIDCLEALKDKMTPEQMAKLEALKQDSSSSTTEEDGTI